MRQATLGTSLPILLALGALVTASQSYAQGSTSQAPRQSQSVLEVIVVTAQKREQSIADVPINISVADQVFIDNYGLDDIEKLADFVPGLQVQAQSLNQPTYALRGIVSDSGVPRVALFQNGVGISDPGYGSNLAIYDLERIEVVKGPQATLFGQGALVGGINFLQSKASLEGNTGSVRLEAGNLDQRRVEGFANIVASDTLAFRVAGQFRDKDGHLDNAQAGDDFGGQEVTAVRGVIRYEPTKRITGNFFFNYQEDESTGTPFKSGFLAPEGGDTSPFSDSALNISSDQVLDELSSEREITSATAELTFEISDAITVTSLTDYRDIQAKEAFDGDGTGFNILGFFSDNESTVVSQELRINFSPDGPFYGFAGINYFERDQDTFTVFSTDLTHLQAATAAGTAAALGVSVAQAEGIFAAAGIPGAENFDNIRDPLIFSAPALILGIGAIPLNTAHLETQDGNERRESLDLFAELSYEVTDKLTITGGVRYAREELEIGAFGMLDRGNAFLGGASNALNFETTLFFEDDTVTGVRRTERETTDWGLTWRFNAAYRLTDKVNTWIAFGRGRRPDVLSPTGSTFTLVDEELLDNAEIGLFGQFMDDSLQVSSSIYFSEYTNFQTSAFDIETGTSVIENAGNATQYGFEVEAQYQLNDHMRLVGSYSYNRSEFDSRDDDGNPLQFAGNGFRLSPKNSYSLAVEYIYPIEDGGTISVFPSYSWRSLVYFEDDNSLSITADGMGGFVSERETFVDGTLVEEFQRSFGVFDLKINYEAASETWGVYLFGENLADEEFIVDAGNTGGGLGLHTYIRGMPRIYGAGVYYHFL